MRTEEASRWRQFRCPHCDRVQLFEIDPHDDLRQWFKACRDCGERLDVRYDPVTAILP